MAEPLKATFFALRRRDHMVLVPATLVMLVLAGLVVAAWVALNWATLGHIYELFSRFAAGEMADEATAMTMFSGFFTLIGTALLFMFPLYMVIASYEAACLRWMIRGEAPGVFGITLNDDVWRVYGVYWCWFLLQLVVSIVMSMVMMPFMFSAMAQIPSHPTPQEMWEWQLRTQLPISLAQYVPLIFLGVRFAPAAATSIVRNRFSFIDAWTVTNGRFLTLLGSFALLWAIAAVVILAGAIPNMLVMWPRFSEMISANTQEAVRAYVAAYTTPDAWIRTGIGYGVWILVALWLSIMSYGVNARAAMAAVEDEKIKPHAD